jgi:prevent-host-death family protein
MEVNVHHAKTHLSKLIAAAESGEEVIIARAGKPSVKLVPITQIAEKSPARKDLFGIWEHLNIQLPSDEEWKAMDKELELSILGPANLHEEAV